MAKIHDMFVIELAEVIKGYGNKPDEDPLNLSMFYRFYELPNIAISRDNFEKMKPYEQPKRKKGRWVECNFPGQEHVFCSQCKEDFYDDDLRMGRNDYPNFCPNCGADMRGGDEQCTT